MGWLRCLFRRSSLSWPQWLRWRKVCSSSKHDPRILSLENLTLWASVFLLLRQWIIFFLRQTDRLHPVSLNLSRSRSVSVLRRWDALLKKRPSKSLTFLIDLDCFWSIEARVDLNGHTEKIWRFWRHLKTVAAHCSHVTACLTKGGFPLGYRDPRNPCRSGSSPWQPGIIWRNLRTHGVALAKYGKVRKYLLCS